MGILNTFFGGKSVGITSTMVRDEIDRSEKEITAHRSQLEGALAGIAVMNDSQHAQAEADVAAIKRAITRLEARANHLVAELPAVVAAEEAATKAATDEALRQRATSAQKANTVEAKKLLMEYDRLAGQMGDVLAKLGAIADERNSVNEALRANPVAERVAGYDDLHRKHADREVSEKRETRPVWCYADGSEEPAVLDREGNVKPKDPKWIHHEQKFVIAELAHRDVVVGRTSFRPGHHESPLAAIHLPPGFAGGDAHWPRNS